MKMLIGLFTMLMTCSAFAGVQGFNGNTNLGLFTGVQCPTAGSLSCTKLGAKLQLSLATTPASATARTRFSSYWTPPTPSAGTLVTPAANTVYLTQIEVPKSTLLTGVGVLNGTTVGTNKYIVAIYSSEGNLLASSAAAGVLTAGASGFQQIPFSNTYIVPGARTVWIAVFVNGATDNFYAMPAMAAMSGLAGSVTGQSFGTVPATLVMPTTFTAGVGPIAFVY